ncbi:hypothetical protein B0H13DRAFT_2315197 [Mycena leptocephala]|nr:hypothetical protein B0H13DRAFT_2315197 [Mycena leptocephala]
MAATKTRNLALATRPHGWEHAAASLRRGNVYIETHLHNSSRLSLPECEMDFVPMAHMGIGRHRTKFLQHAESLDRSRLQCRLLTLVQVPSYTPVAIFVGGTSGIGQGMAVAFACPTKGNAHIVLVGRNRATAESILATFPKPGPGVTHEFIECDMTLMSNVNRVETELRARIQKINFLLAVHYYGRWHFIKDLLPAVEAAKEEGEDGKLMSVLAAGRNGKIDLDDLGLDLPAPQPALIFIHAHPAVVASNLYKSSNTPLIRAAKAFFTPLLAPFILRDDIGLTKGHFGSKETMERLWAHTEEATKA